MTFASWFFSLCIEGFVLCSVGLIACAALRGHSASWRHLSLTATVFGLLLLPFLVVIPPLIALPIPTAFFTTDVTTNATIANDAESHRRDIEYDSTYSGDQAHSTNGNTLDVFTPGHDRPSADTVGDPASLLRSAGPTEAAGFRQDSLDVEGNIVEVKPTPSVRLSEIATAIVVVWSVGAFATLMMPLVGLFGVHRTRLASESIVDSRWRNLLDGLCEELGIRGKVELRTSSVVQSAMTWGVLRPTILLPTVADRWSHGERRIVLLHELGHIRRFDWATQMLGALCCSLHWFNPMVWWISRQMRIEREQACDDLVLGTGIEPTVYAEKLIESAKQFRAYPSLAAIPMAQQSRLEQRMRAILDRDRRRESPGNLMIGATFAVFTIVMLPLALIGATGDPPSQPNNSDKGAAASADDKEADTTNAEDHEQLAEATVVKEKFRVINGDDGTPIAGAKVSYDPKVVPSSLFEDTLTAVARTDQRGEVELPQDTLSYLKFRVSHPAFLRGEFAKTGATFPGQTLYKTLWPYGQVKGQKVLKLWPSETIKGTVKYENGKPARDFEFQIVSPSTHFGWYRKIVEPRVASAMGPDESRPAVEWRCNVTTDDSGNFSIAVPPRSVRKELRALGNSKKVAPFYQVIEVGTADIKLQRGTIVRGIYRNVDGSPAAKTSVTLSPVLPDGDLAITEIHRVATTDETGRFELAPAASGPHVLMPYRGIPKRLNLEAGRAVKVDAQVAPYYELKFDFENTMGHLSGNFNFGIHGDVQPRGGGKPIERIVVPFTDGDKITFRVPQSMKNAKLHFMNWSTQSVRIVEESGNVFLPSEDANPLDLPDLSNPPKLKICMGTAARFYVDVREADGTLAKNIEVTGEATSDDGSRKIGSFWRSWRSGEVWVKGGLFEGERVTVTVRRGDWSATSKPFKPVDVEANDPANKAKFKLPAM